MTGPATVSSAPMPPAPRGASLCTATTHPTSNVPPPSCWSERYRPADARIDHWAHLHDRALITNGHLQEYGTQLLLNPDGITLCPLRAPESLDERRATVGLPPITVALEAVRRRYAPDHLADDAPTVVLAGAA